MEVDKANKRLCRKRREENGIVERATFQSLEAWEPREEPQERKRTESLKPNDKKEMVVQQGQTQYRDLERESLEMFTGFRNR